jgi:hypothetical protein
MKFRSSWCRRGPVGGAWPLDATEGEVDDGSEFGQGSEAARAADLRLDGSVERLGSRVRVGGNQHPLNAVAVMGEGIGQLLERGQARARPS